MNIPEKPQEQYMLLFNQYKILGVSMAPSSYTPEQIADQINKLKTTVFKGKNIPDVTEKEVEKLQEVIAQNIEDKRKAYEQFKKDNNSSNLSTKLADLTESANKKFDKFAEEAKGKLSAVASVTKDKFTNLGRSAKEMGTSAVDSASGATRVLGLSFDTLAQKRQFNIGKDIGKDIAAKVQAEAAAKAAARSKMPETVQPGATANQALARIQLQDRLKDPLFSNTHGGKRRRHTIKKNCRSIHRTTIRRRQYKNNNKKNRSFKR